MPKSKIIHIIDSFNVGGLENGLINIINFMEGNYTHEICCLRQSGPSSFRLKKNVNISELHKKEGKDISLYFRLFKIIKHFKPDIVHTRNWGTIDAVFIAKLAGVKKIVHGEHGWNPDDPTGLNLKRRIFRHLSSFFINSFIAVSEDIALWLQRKCWVQQKKINTIINGVDSEKFKPRTNEYLRYKKTFFNDNDFIIGTVGRLDPIKNFDILIEAFALLNPKINNLKLLIVGNGNELSNLKKTAIATGISDSIIFAGERHDLNHLYPFMDIFVLPSQNEGISNTILEAMSSGCPVIASNVGGTPELIDHEKCGLLVPPDSVNSLLDALKFYMENPAFRKEMGINARKKVLECFSLTKMLSKYENTYKSVLGII